MNFLSNSIHFQYVKYFQKCKQYSQDIRIKIRSCDKGYRLPSLGQSAQKSVRGGGEHRGQPLVLGVKFLMFTDDFI